MNKYIPDMYYKSIFDIDYEKLVKQNIKLLLFDLDNTIIPDNVKNTFIIHIRNIFIHTITF